jgi:hypothetical protein
MEIQQIESQQSKSTPHSLIISTASPQQKQQQQHQQTVTPHPYGHYNMEALLN